MVLLPEPALSHKTLTSGSPFSIGGAAGGSGPWLVDVLNTVEAHWWVLLTPQLLRLT